MTADSSRMVALVPLLLKSNAAQSLIEDYAACLELRSEESQTIEDTKYDIGVLIIQVLTICCSSIISTAHPQISHSSTAKVSLQLLEVLRVRHARARTLRAGQSLVSAKDLCQDPCASQGWRTKQLQVFSFVICESEMTLQKTRLLGTASQGWRTKQLQVFSFVICESEMTLQKTRLLGTATSTKNVPRGSFTVKRHFILRVCKLQENTFRVFIDFGFANYRCSSCKLRVHISGGGSFPLASVTSLADPFPLPSVDTNNLKWVKSYKRTRVPFFPVVQISRLHVPLESKYLEPVILDTLHVFLIGLFSWEMETVTSMNTYRECNCSVTLLVSSSVNCKVQTVVIGGANLGKKC
ncbi:uncharacterized protein LOC113271964 [Papaver somniferum]|uniref:uncharacterized protein LOC113271964 n=1 Tax=Papaver somniferum TaxID=3469 RepID=UPI000E6FCD35|nr:uncharacterized protein LOC113271964 [Papaver somniferum]